MNAMVVVLALVGAVAPAAAAAQAVSAADRDALVALHVGRGGRPGDLDQLIRLANEAGARGLPVRPLLDKIREGVSKRAHPARIEVVIRQMAADLDTATHLVREWTPEAAAPAREEAVTLLAEALGGTLAPDGARSGLTSDEARELGRELRAGSRVPPAPDALASAARGLAFIKDAHLSVSEGTALMAEAARQRFAAHDLLDLGRQIKLRERDYQRGRATLGALRDAIARGERPERIFREGRAGEIERPAAVRPQTPERPERPVRPEAPLRPERPGRP